MYLHKFYILVEEGIYISFSIKEFFGKEEFTFTQW